MRRTRGSRSRRSFRGRRRLRLDDPTIAHRHQRGAAEANTSWPSCTCPPRQAPKRASCSPNSTRPRTGNITAAAAVEEALEGRQAARLLSVGASGAELRLGVAAGAGTPAATAALSGRQGAGRGVVAAYRNGEPSVQPCRACTSAVFCSEDGSGGTPGRSCKALRSLQSCVRLCRRPRAQRGRLRRRRRAGRDRSSRRPSSSTSADTRRSGRHGCSTGSTRRASRRARSRRARGRERLRGARPEWGPPLELIELDSADEVDALDGPPEGHDLAMAWAWLDEGPGSSARARFGADRDSRGRGRRLGRDEAVRALARPIEIRQGRGSRILCPGRSGRARRDGGRSVEDDVRAYALP